jgi:hypothetical protein
MWESVYVYVFQLMHRMQYRRDYCKELCQTNFVRCVKIRQVYNTKVSFL